MTLALENDIARYLGSVEPRHGFAPELLAALTHDSHHLYQLDPVGSKPRTRWIVAGAVAGVVSATGAAYLSARRRSARGVA